MTISSDQKNNLGLVRVYCFPMEITAAGSSLVSFAHGWHSELDGDPLSPHRWSDAVDAAINIPKINFSPLHSSKVNVELDAIPYLPPNGVGFQDVFLFLDGAVLAGFRLYDGEIKSFKGHFANPINNNPFSQIRILCFFL